MNMQTLESVKQQWECVVDSMPQFICLLARDGRVLRANRTVERWKLGIDIKDVAGNQLHDVLHHGCSNHHCFLTHFAERVAAVLAKSRRANCNVWDPVLKRQLLIRAHRPMPAQREYAGLDDVFAVVTIDDVTEFKAIAKEFIEPSLALKPRAGQGRAKPTDAEQDHSHVIDAIDKTPSFFAMADAGAVLYYLNPAGRTLLGLPSEEEVHGMKLLDCYAPRMREHLAKIALPAAARDGTWSGESVLLARDGREIRTASLVVAHHRSDGRLASFSVQERDLTQQVTAEQDTSTQSAAFAHALSEAMPLPVFYTDASGRYTGCNNAFARFVGRTKDEILGKTVFEVAPQELAEEYRERDLDLLRDPTGTQTYESSVAHADGTVRAVIFHKTRMTDSTGNPGGTVGVITDITELKQIHAQQSRLQAQLREAQKMEILGTLAGGVAHDFNNIVAAINGNVELACQDVGPEHAALRSLEEIRKASHRAKDLVQRILAFGRKQDLDRKAISLVPVVQEAGRLLRSTLPAGVALEVQCNADAPPVLADATQIVQVLLNLCSNAWQAIQGQDRAGRIDVRLEPALRDGLCHASLTVRDNGQGMDEATRSHVFEPFFTTKPVGEGTGLGLSVVHGILQEHGASVEVESVPGDGTTFVILFPAAQAPEPVASQSVAHAALAHGEGRRLLYVDDNEAIVLLMRRLLERQGYRVNGYTDPIEALAAVRANPEAFDLAVTDFQMPGMSGLELARALREIRASLPVALVSGSIGDELLAEAPAAGVREVIYKADTVDQLYEAVARLAQAVAAEPRAG